MLPELILWPILPSKHVGAQPLYFPQIRNSVVVFQARSRESVWPVSEKSVRVVWEGVSESVAYHCTLRVLLTSTLYITSHSHAPSLLSVSAVIRKQRPPLGSLLYYTRLHRMLLYTLDKVLINV